MPTDADGKSNFEAWTYAFKLQTRRNILSMNQVMYIGRIGWAVRLVSRFRTVRCGEIHQMMYEIVDLSILQHFFESSTVKAVGFVYPDWISPSKNPERSLFKPFQLRIRGPRIAGPLSTQATVTRNSLAGIVECHLGQHDIRSPSW